MRKNVFLLSLCQALMNSGNALLAATSALVGQHLASDKSLATLAGVGYGVQDEMSWLLGRADLAS